MPAEYIYVLARDKSPLMPTTRHGHVQKLLRKGKARVAMHRPFVIQLKYDTPGITQPLFGGGDPGRTNQGDGVVGEDGTVVYKDHVTTRNKDIPKLMAERSEHRQASRRGERLKRKRRAKKNGTTKEFPEGRKLPGCEKPIPLKDITNQEARFNNRKRPEGWLTPTARHLVQTYVNQVRNIMKFLPVVGWTLEINRFVFMLMEDGTVRGVDFQNGRMRGYDSVDDYIYHLQDGKCACCGKPIAHFHHIVPRHEGGSDRPENIIGLCGTCHEEVHIGRRSLEAVGEKKKYSALSVLNQAIPFICEELEKMFGAGFTTCTGYETKTLREIYGIGKTHDNDAVCIASYPLNPDVVDNDCRAFEIHQFRRHDRGIINHITERTYYLDGKPVAKNRKPRFEQKGPALSDLNLPREEISRLKVKKSTRYYNDPDRIMPGAVFLHNGERHILKGREANGYYFIPMDGAGRIKASECHIVRQNTGLVYL